MTAPFIWIGLPAITAGILYLLRRHITLVRIIGISISLLLALSAWKIPVETDISISWLRFLPTFRIAESFPILGRQFVINSNTQTVMLLIYLNASLWFIGSLTIPVSKLFIPLGLAISSILASAISVSPFIYSALLIEMAVLTSIPILSPPGGHVSRGVRRFLIFQTLGMTILVFSGWMVEQVQLDPTNQEVVQTASIFLGLGFGVIISLFPFSTWIPMVAEKSNPFTAGFIFFTIPEIIALFAILTIRQFNWLFGSQDILFFIQIVSILMIIGAGMWAIFQNNLGRIFGYAIVLEIGMTTLSLGLIISYLGLQNTVSLQSAGEIYRLFYPLLLPRGLSIAIWALALSIIKNVSSTLEFSDIRGIGSKYPIAVSSIFLAVSSFSGLPITAGYLLKILLSTSAAQNSMLIGYLVIFGSIGLILAIMRSLFFLIPSTQNIHWEFNETGPQITLLIFGIVILLAIGIFPGMYLQLANFVIPGN